MREPVRDRRRLEHIIDAIDRVLESAKTMEFDDLCKDVLRYYGIVKCIEIIGEASYRLTNRFRDAHPETPWLYIIKMRHLLVHDYYQIGAEDVWDVIQGDLAPLREQIYKYLVETDWEAWKQQEEDK